MNRRLLMPVCFLYFCWTTLTACKSRNIDAVQIVFFDLSDFDRTDTLWINNIDTLNIIENLFSSMKTADVKFPRRYQITILGNGLSEVYYSNGRYVETNRKIYVLPDGKDLILLESILRSR